MQKEQLEVIKTPHPHDVLCGRGHAVNNHPGNVRFRKLWVSFKLPYCLCELNSLDISLQDLAIWLWCLTWIALICFFCSDHDRVKEHRVAYTCCREYNIHTYLCLTNWEHFIFVHSYFSVCCINAHCIWYGMVSITQQNSKNQSIPKWYMEKFFPGIRQAGS